jgi:hypothetical protein
MMRLKCTIAASVVLVSTAAVADDFDIKEGSLIHKHGMTTRLVSLTNNTSAKASVFVTCAFFRMGSLVGIGAANFYNLKPGETAHEAAVEPDTGDADATKCRVDVVNRERD